MRMQGGLFSHSRARRSETVKLQMLSRKRVCANKICVWSLPENRFSDENLFND